MPRVTVKDAAQALQQLASERGQAAAGTNTTVSRQEQATLDPFLSAAAEGVRTAGGKNTRVTVAALAERAVADAGQVWTQHNAPGPGQKFLSQAELQAVAKTDPALGALSKLAYLRASQGAGGADAKADVVAYFSGLSFEPDPDTGWNTVRAGLPGSTKIDARPIFPEQRVGVPANVLTSFDCFYRLEQADVGGATLQRAKVSGHDVYVVYASTDGDDAYLEVLDKKGAPLASARLSGNQIVSWDEAFGRDRFTQTMVSLDEPAQEEGLSDPVERAAAGQIPADWAGDVTLSQGRLHYDAYSQLGKIDVPALEGSPRQELGTAALQYLWERSLRDRVVGGSEPFLLGAVREGTMNLGTFTRADGQIYEVANWRDIDDASFTLYFDRAEGGRLRLVSEQSNG